MDFEFRQHQLNVVTVAYLVLEANGRDVGSNVVVSLT